MTVAGMIHVEGRPQQIIVRNHKSPAVNPPHLVPAIQLPRPHRHPKYHPHTATPFKSIRPPKYYQKPLDSRRPRPRSDAWRPLPPPKPLKQKTGRHITKTSIGSRRVDAVPAQPLPSKQSRKERKNVPKKEDNSEIIWGRPIVPQQQFQKVEKYIPAETAQSPIVIVTPVQDIPIKKEAKKKQESKKDAIKNVKQVVSKPKDDMVLSSALKSIDIKKVKPVVLKSKDDISIVSAPKAVVVKKPSKESAPKPVISEPQVAEKAAKPILKAKQVKHIPLKQAKKERQVNAKPQATASAAKPSSKAKPTKRIPPKQAKKELQFNAKRYSVPVKPKTINEKRLPKKASTYKSRQAVVQPQPFIFSNQVRTERQAATADYTSSLDTYNTAPADSYATVTFDDPPPSTIEARKIATPKQSSYKATGRSSEPIAITRYVYNSPTGEEQEGDDVFNYEYETQNGIKQK